jgi:hypothetical protein
MFRTDANDEVAAIHRQERHHPSPGVRSVVVRGLVGNSDFDSDSLDGRNPEFRFRVWNSGSFRRKIKSENLKTVQVENRNSGSDFSGIPEFR